MAFILPSFSADVGRFPVITASGAGDQINTYISSATLPSIVASGVGIQIPLSAGAATLPLTTGSGEAVQNASVSLPVILGTGTAFQTAVQVTQVLPAIIAEGYATQAATSFATLRRIVADGYGYSGVTGDSSAFLPSIIASGYGYSAVSGQSVGVTLPMILASGYGISVGVNVSAIAIQTESQALTLYQNYQFNSFAKFNGAYLGANAEGVFNLSGEDDNGTDVDAWARVGITDYDTSYRKRIDRMYVGYRCTGPMVLRVFTEENIQRDYTLRATNIVGLHGNHVRIGKGVEARYWQFEIRNTQGSYFELDMMEAKPTVLGRRIGGRSA